MISGDERGDKVGPLPGNVPGPIGCPLLGEITGQIGRRLGLEARPVNLDPTRGRTIARVTASGIELTPATRADLATFSSSTAAPVALAAGVRAIRPIEKRAGLTASQARNRHRRHPDLDTDPQESRHPALRVREMAFSAKPRQSANPRPRPSPNWPATRLRYRRRTAARNP
jgi:hypothetical protein